MCLVFPNPCAVRVVSRALNILARVGTCAGTSFVQCFAWSARAMYHLPGLVLVLVSLVQCFARSARAMYLLARVHVCVVCESLHSVYCACIPCTVLRLVRTGHVPTCPCSHLYWYLLCSWAARALYLLARVRACILVQCFVMGNPSHVRVLVFELSRCNCSATPTDMDSLLLVMSRDGFYVRCICAGCLYLTCRGAIVCLPVCTANREGWQPRLICTYVYNTSCFFCFFCFFGVFWGFLAGIRTHVPATPFYV